MGCPLSSWEAVPDLPLPLMSCRDVMELEEQKLSVDYQMKSQATEPLFPPWHKTTTITHTRLNHLPITSFSRRSRGDRREADAKVVAFTREDDLGRLLTQPIPIPRFTSSLHDPTAAVKGGTHSLKRRHRPTPTTAAYTRLVVVSSCLPLWPVSARQNRTTSSLSCCHVCCTSGDEGPLLGRFPHYTTSDNNNKVKQGYRLPPEVEASVLLMPKKAPRRTRVVMSPTKKSKVASTSLNHPVSRLCKWMDV